MEEKLGIIKGCPEIPFFGASYPDAQCCDGLLYDMDSWDDEAGGMTSGGDIPCPFCRTEDFIEYDYFGRYDYFMMELAEERGIDYDSPELDKFESEINIKVREWYLIWIKKMKEIYG